MWKLAARLEVYYRLACAFDGYAFDHNKVYLFSPFNPYKKPYYALSRLYWRIRFERNED